MCRLALGADGSIFFTYQSTTVDEDTRALVRFAPDGSSATLLGTDNALAIGVGIYVPSSPLLSSSPPPPFRFLYLVYGVCISS